MYLGDVIGRVIATAKNDSLTGRTLLLVRRVADARTVVAIDSVGAGAGERVYVCRGKEAAYPFAPVETPSDATIVGIVDRIDEESMAGQDKNAEESSNRRGLTGER